MKSISPTWIFAGVVVIVAGFALYEFRKGDPDASSGAAIQLFKFQSDSAKVVKLAVTSPDKEILIEKKGENWHILKPVEDLGDTLVIDNYANSNLEHKGQEVVFEGKGDIAWKSYGFEKPMGTMIVTSDSGETQKLTVGSVEAYDGKLYARINDENRLLVIDSNWKSALNRSIIDLRDKHIFRHAPTEALRFTVHDYTKGQELDFEKVKNKWVLKQNEKMPIDQDMVKDYLDKIYSLKASDWVDEEIASKVLGEKRLNDPRVQIEIYFVSDKTDIWKMKAGREVDKSAYVQVDGTKPLFKTADANIDALMKKASDFKDRKFPFQFDTSLAQHIRVKSGATSFELKKDGANWMPIEEVDGKEVDAEQVQALLDHMHNLEAKSFQDYGKHIQSLKSEVEVKDAKGKLLFSLKWGDLYIYPKADNPKLKDEYNLAETNLSAFAMEVDASRLKALPLQNLFKNKVKTPDKSSNMTTEVPKAASTEKPVDKGASVVK
jgi:hypothetical protein